MRRIAGPACLFIGLLLFAPPPALSQAPAATFEELRLTLRSGDSIVVTQKDGHRSRVRVQRITDQELIVRATSGLRRRPTGATLSYAKSSVSEIKRTDPLNRGLALGLAVGIGLAVAPCFMDTGTPGDGGCVVGVIFAGPVFGLIGMGAGALIDASIKQTMYRAASAPSFTLAPLLGPHTAGLSASLRF